MRDNAQQIRHGAACDRSISRVLVIEAVVTRAELSTLLCCTKYRLQLLCRQFAFVLEARTYNGLQLSVEFLYCCIFVFFLVAQLDKLVPLRSYPYSSTACTQHTVLAAPTTMPT